MQTTYERLRAILVQDYKLDPEQVSLGARLHALGIGSLGMTDLLSNVEEEFLVILPHERVALHTVGDVVKFIDGLIAEQSGRIVRPSAVAAGALHST